MIEKVAAYTPGKGIARGVKRAKNQVRMEKIKAAKIDLGAGGALGVLSFLACRAMEIAPTIAPIVAVILTPIVGKHFLDRYEGVERAKDEYNRLKNSDEYQRILKRQDYMQKRKMLRRN